MTLARDLMTRDVRTIDETDTLDLALQIMSEHRIRHVPVVDDDRRLVGMISDRDLRALGIGALDELGAADRLRWKLARRALSFMARDVITVAPDDDVLMVLDRMIGTQHGALPVVEPESGLLVGIISYVDVLRAVRVSILRNEMRRSRERLIARDRERERVRHA